MARIAAAQDPVTAGIASVRAAGAKLSSEEQASKPQQRDEIAESCKTMAEASAGLSRTGKNRLLELLQEATKPIDAEPI